MWCRAPFSVGLLCPAAGGLPCPAMRRKPVRVDAPALLRARHVSHSKLGQASIAVRRFSARRFPWLREAPVRNVGGASARVGNGEDRGDGSPKSPRSPKSPSNLAPPGAQPRRKRRNFARRQAGPTSRVKHAKPRTAGVIPGGFREFPCPPRSGVSVSVRQGAAPKARGKALLGRRELVRRRARRPSP